MASRMVQRNLAQTYLALIPVIVAVIGVAIGHISSTIYFPIWILNGILMIIAVWVLGANLLRSKNPERNQLIIVAILLILPWALLFILMGLGIPPDNPVEWLATLWEQKMRYGFLIIAGILVTLGFVTLGFKLNKAGENFYSSIGMASMLIAAPIFILDMTYYHSYLPEMFRIQVSTPTLKEPEWFLPTRSHYSTIAVVEVALVYLSTAFMAASLKKMGWFRSTGAICYIILSMIGFLLTVLYPSFPWIVGIAGYPFVMIPAVGLMMPYYIGVNLLRKLGSNELILFPA